MQDVHAQIYEYTRFPSLSALVMFLYPFFSLSNNVENHPHLVRILSSDIHCSFFQDVRAFSKPSQRDLDGNMNQVKTNGKDLHGRVNKEIIRKKYLSCSMFSCLL